MAKTSELTLFGAAWCQDCTELKRFLGEHKQNYTWVDIETIAGASALAKINPAKTIPTVVVGGETLVEPSVPELADQLGIPETAETDFHDLIIIGAGPTGLSAAIYTTREDIKTELFEKNIVGGLASITDTIDNYPGFPDGVSGLELAAAMEKQARRFGANFKTGVEVTKIEPIGRYLKVNTTSSEHMAKTVLIATGSDYRRLGVPGERELTSRGVHYCATCDGPFYKGKELIVIGGGNSAMQESLFLTKFATKITMLVRGPELKGSEILINKIKSIDNIHIYYNVSSTEIKGEFLKQMIVTTVNSKTGKSAQFQADGVFVFIGLVPNTRFLKGVLDLDPAGFVVTDKTFQTSIPGVYAAGDVRSGSTLQIASAVGEGVVAALMIRHHLRENG